MSDIKKESLKQAIEHGKRAKDNLVASAGSLPKGHHYTDEFDEIMRRLENQLDVLEGHLWDLENIK